MLMQCSCSVTLKSRIYNKQWFPSHNPQVHLQMESACDNIKIWKVGVQAQA